MFVSNIDSVFHINNQNKLPNYYLLKLLKCKEYRTIINDYCLGGARAGLKLDWLSKIKVELPSTETIETTTDLSDELDRAYNEYMRLLKQLS